METKKIIYANLGIFLVLQLFNFLVFQPKNLLGRWDAEVWILSIYALTNLVSLFYIEGTKEKTKSAYTFNVLTYLFILYFLVIAFESLLVAALMIYLAIPLVLVGINLGIEKIKAN
ncbi:MAG: hypothetical protein O2779_05220 [Nanoarchaeota archaeon]|nr:hypothetical protein [Nanoarchaeota archaeon]